MSEVVKQISELKDTVCGNTQAIRNMEEELNNAKKKIIQELHESIKRPKGL